MRGYKADDLTALPRIVITPGEPAGIGPDLAVRIAQQTWPAQLIAVADPDLLMQRAQQLGLDLVIDSVPDANAGAHQPGHLPVLPVALNKTAVAGQLQTANADYVLKTLAAAVDGCTGTGSGRRFDALVTGPVHKAVINDAGIAFDGHTHWLARRTGASLPVMMLATQGLRVALATVHIPLREVAKQLNQDMLRHTIEVLHGDLRQHFDLPAPRILVAGLNPHAGEGGYLGREEIEIMQPVLEQLRNRGMQLTGPLPADTLFTLDKLAEADAVLAMYHDQGLPVIKHLGFGRTVNITLGLPIIRTSVDHGTALDLAGSDAIDIGSMQSAISTAIDMVRHGT